LIDEFYKLINIIDVVFSITDINEMLNYIKADSEIAKAILGE